MNDSPLVSIVTPSYNTGQFIEETILSIRNQDYPFKEHIVFDGNSTDGTLEILEKYEHIIWKSEQDKGQSDALNKGFKAAKGDFIGWLNSDDTYTPHAMTEAVNYLRENKDTDIVCTDVHIIDENSRVIGKSKGREITLMNLLVDNPVKQPSVFMRRHVIDTLIGLDTRLHFVMDREFWLRAMWHGFKISYLPNKTFANFRLCEGTKTFESTPKFRKEWQQVLLGFFENSDSLELTKRLKRKILNKNCSQFYLSQSQKEIGRPGPFIRSIFFSAFYDPTILLNTGYYKLCILGLLGMRRNKYDDAK